MKQLIEEQLQAFDKQEEAYMTDLVAYYHAQWSSTEEEKEVYRIEAEKSRNVLNEWYVTSLKQFIDELIAREESKKKDEWNIQDEFIESHAEYNEAKRESITHLKELKEELN